MGLYDAVDRGGAGRKKEKTLRRPLLIAAAILAAVIALIAWSCRYFFQYRSWVSDLTEATRYARRTGAFTVTVAGAAAVLMGLGVNLMVWIADIAGAAANTAINEIINETSLNIFVTSENYCLSLKYTPARVII